MTRQTPTRRELGLAALAIRDELHFAKLRPEVGLSAGADMLRSLGILLDEFLLALQAECGVEAITKQQEPFYDLANLIAERFDERRREIDSLADSDARTDRGCWSYHQGS